MAINPYDYGVFSRNQFSNQPIDTQMPPGYRTSPFALHASEGEMFGGFDFPEEPPQSSRFPMPARLTQEPPVASQPQVSHPPISTIYSTNESPVEAVVTMGTPEAASAVKREMKQAQEQRRAPAFRLEGSRLFVGPDVSKRMEGQPAGTVSGMGYGKSTTDDMQKYFESLQQAKDNAQLTTTPTSGDIKTQAQSAMSRWQMLDPLNVMTRAKKAGFSAQATQRALAEATTARGQYPKWAFDLATDIEKEKVKAELMPVAKITPDDMYVMALMKEKLGQPLDKTDERLIKSKSGDKDGDSDILKQAVDLVVGSEKLSVTPSSPEDLAAKVNSVRAQLKLSGEQASASPVTSTSKYNKDDARKIYLSIIDKHKLGKTDTGIAEAKAIISRMTTQELDAIVGAK